MTADAHRTMTDLNASPASMAAATIASSLLIEFTKPNQRRRAVHAIERARDALTARAHVHGIRESNPQGQCRARIEAAAALDVVLADLCNSSVRHDRGPR